MPDPWDSNIEWENYRGSGVGVGTTGIDWCIVKRSSKLITAWIKYVKTKSVLMEKVIHYFDFQNIFPSKCSTCAWCSKRLQPLDSSFAVSPVWVTLQCLTWRNRWVSIIVIFHSLKEQLTYMVGMCENQPKQVAFHKRQFLSNVTCDCKFNLIIGNTASRPIFSCLP